MSAPDQGIGLPSMLKQAPDRIDEYPGSNPDQFRELAHYLKSHTPPKMKLCERSELYVPQKLLLQFVCFTIPNESVLLVGEVRGYPGQSFERFFGPLS